MFELFSEFLCRCFSLLKSQLDVFGSTLEAERIFQLNRLILALDFADSIPHPRVPLIFP